MAFYTYKAYSHGSLASSWLAFLLAGVPKLLAVTVWIEKFTHWGYPRWFLALIGLLEMSGAILLLIPRLAIYGVGILIAVMEAQLAAPRPVGEQMKKRLLDAREAVWRAWFTGDRATLEKLIPEETIAIDSGDSKWDSRQTILDGSVAFVQAGAKLVRLEFPKTEIQMYGVTAIIYSAYLYELDQAGQHTTHTGRATEVFVLRNGQWVNPGWHMDSGK